MLSQLKRPLRKGREFSPVYELCLMSLHTEILRVFWQHRLESTIFAWQELHSSLVTGTASLIPALPLALWIFPLVYWSLVLLQGWWVGISRCLESDLQNVRLKRVESRSPRSCSFWAMNHVKGSHAPSKRNSCFLKGESESFPWYSAW